jgi:alanine dehydrogenase
VALVPDGVAKLTKAGCTVIVQRGAGTGAYLPDADFEAAGATIVGSAAEAFAADLVRRQRPTAEEAALLPWTALVSFAPPRRLICSARSPGAR